MSQESLHVSSFMPPPLPKKKLALCIFNRATYSRCSALLDEISRFPNLDLTVLLSSSLLWKEYGEAGKTYPKAHGNLKFVYLPVRPTDGTHLGMALASSRILLRFSYHFAKNAYEGVLVIGDRFETLPAAMAAAYQNIPLIHLQGGEITGNIDEKVRHAVSKLSDYHFVATQNAKTYLYEMGEEKERIHHTGCPSLDLIRKEGIRRFRPKERYFLCIFHPETERVEKAYDQTRAVLQAVLKYCAKHQQRCYWYYPNPDPGREKITSLLNQALEENPVYLIQAINKTPRAFLSQLAGARFILGNSSSGLREASCLGVPAINVGERQSLRERSWNVIDVGYDPQEIFSQMELFRDYVRLDPSYLYGSKDASRWIVRYLNALDFELKGPLDYPRRFEFRAQHLEEVRFGDHRKKRRKAPSSEQQQQAPRTLDPQSEREAL